MIKLKQYSLSSRQVHLIFENGVQHIIYLNSYSGKVYYRMKINTFSGVKHTGIYLGQDAHGTNYYMHNHFLTGKPSIVTENEFAKGKQLYEDNTVCINSQFEIVQRALHAIVTGERYDFITFNCQTFTSNACNNVRYSPDVENWKGLAFAGLAVFAIATILNGK